MGGSRFVLQRHRSSVFSVPKIEIRLSDCKSMPEKISPEEAKTVLKAVLDNLPDERRSNLLSHLKSSAKLYCGPIAYKVSGENAGCLLAMACSKTLPNHFLDLAEMRRIDDLVCVLYNEIFQLHKLKYYFSTQVFSENTLRQFVIEYLESLPCQEQRPIAHAESIATHSLEK